MFYVFKNNQQWGPYSVEELNGYISAGNFSLDDLTWSADQAAWVPVRKILGDSTIQHTQSSNSIELDHAIKTESQDTSIICPNKLCIKRNNPEECAGCDFWMMSKETNNKLPKFTVRTERDIIRQWMETKFVNYKKYRGFGWLLGIVMLVVAGLIFIGLSVTSEMPELDNGEKVREGIASIAKGISDQKSVMTQTELIKNSDDMEHQDIRSKQRTLTGVGSEFVGYDIGENHYGGEYYAKVVPRAVMLIKAAMVNQEATIDILSNEQIDYESKAKQAAQQQQEAISNMTKAKGLMEKVAESMEAAATRGNILRAILKFSLLCCVFAFLILAFHFAQFGLAVFWILPDAKKKTNRHITGRFILWFFLHVLICAGTTMFFEKFGGEIWVIFALLFFFVFLAPSMWWYPYCLLARCPYPNGIYYEYWTHSKDPLGGESENLYSKRIWENGQLVFWKQWDASSMQDSLRKYGYNSYGESKSPLTRTPLVYRLGFDERKNAFAWAILKKRAKEELI